MSKTQTALKRIFVGRPMASEELEHTLLPKVIALPIFASDALSSMAYATQEILLVLGTAGVVALGLVVPVSIAVSLLLAVVVLSYRQIVRAYPSGGGAYIVARENLGLYAGLLVGAALLVDYTLTVAVSTTAGVDAIVSAVTALAPYKVILVIGFILLVMLANLRGVKESGTLFAIPTYGFILSILLMIVLGIAKCAGGCPSAPSAAEALPSLSALTPLLVLRAFAAGTTALTGVEAIAEGVPVFRFPQSRNAAKTLAILGVVSITMFVGVSWLADHADVVYRDGDPRTVVAQVALAVFGGGFGFYAVQVLTAAILILAANTAFNGFPVLMSILARDGVMPRHFLNRGDRLVLSNGIVILAFFACVLVYIFKANLNHLIQLYLIGVFISFTIAQAGTVLRWRKIKTPGWRKSATINAIGAGMTGIVLVVVLVTKFLLGAWIIVILIPLLVLLMRSIYLHLKDVREQLAHPDRRPIDRRPGSQHAVIYVTRVDAPTARAVGYARATRIAGLKAVTLNGSLAGAWRELAPEIPLAIIGKEGSTPDALKNFLRRERIELPPDDFLTIMVPETLKSSSLVEVLRRPKLHRLKAALLPEHSIQVMDFPMFEADIDPNVDESREPARNYVVVLAAGVNNATLQAIEYAETLHASDIRGVNFGLGPEGSERLGDEWLQARIPHPLGIEASPFRDIGVSVRNYVRGLRPDGVNRVVTVVIPEFVVPQRRHQILHGQTALIVKRHLLFERGVVVVSVPYHLDR